MKHSPPDTRLLLLGPLVSTLALAGCGSYHNIKGRVELQLDEPLKGIESLETATRHAPTDAAFKLDYLRNRDERVRGLLIQADASRSAGKLREAQSTYEQVLQMDRSNARARAALANLPQDARFERLLLEGEAFLVKGSIELAVDRASQVLEGNPQNLRAAKLREAALDAKNQAALDRAKIQTAGALLDKPVTLQFNDATLRIVFEALSKSTGLNILLDRDVRPTAKVTIFVKDISVVDAIDFILMQNQLEKRIINGNTLMIYPLTDAKKAEYEDLAIRSFQVTNADLKYLSSMLRTMLKLKEISADERTGILVIRDTPERLRLAAKLIAVHDVADPEIMLEVEILEVTTTRRSNIGVTPPTSLSIYTPGGTAGLTVGALRALQKNDLLVSPLSATINLKLEDSDAKLLASPRIRARNKEKAKIMIGDRVPTITNTLTPIATGASVVTGSVTYQDVGLKLDFEPQVYTNDEVGIRISLEVSNIAAEFTDAQGGRSYQIGTRNATTNLRLRDGETQVLGGLITDQDRNTASKIPGLGHLPIIGRLFGNNDGSDTSSEIVLAITPRIIRNLPASDPEVRMIFSGTVNVPREKPILAEPITQVRAGSFAPGIVTGGNQATTGVTGSSGPSMIGIPPATSSPAISPPILSAPPPMVVRPAPSAK